MSSENHSNGSSTAQDRFSGGVSAFRQSRRESALSAAPDASDTELPTRTPGPGPQPLAPAGALDRTVSLPSLDLQGLTEPVFGPVGWMEHSVPAPAPSMAEHPLLRGLLLELPTRGAVPPPGWLDRWFEAARSILELLYVQDASRGSR